MFIMKLFDNTNRNFKLLVSCLSTILVMLVLIYSFDVKYLPFLNKVAKAKYPPQLDLVTSFTRQLNSSWRETTGGFNFQATNWPKEELHSNLRIQLNESFPYDPLAPMPKSIWQTWKVGLESPDFPEKDRIYIETWIDKNPNYTYSLITDAEMETIVNTEFANVPQVIETFYLMPKPVLKADFFRYLIIFARGGIYTDIDTISLKPIDSWVSSQSVVYNQTNNPGLIAGIEADPTYKHWTKHYSRRLQFVQWTLQGKSGHPILRELIAKICEKTIDRFRNDALDEIFGKDAGDDIMNWTGPGIWTDSIFEYMNSLFQTEEYFKHKTWDEYHTYLDWRTFTGIKKPIVVHDVVILPITSFSPGIKRMGAGSTEDEMAYVQHTFGGSWKNGKINE